MDATVAGNHDASRPSLLTPPPLFSTNWVALLSNTTTALTPESKSPAVAAAEVGNATLTTSHLHGTLVCLDATAGVSICIEERPDDGDYWLINSNYNEMTASRGETDITGEGDGR